ncbi:MAG: hypothetical protein FJ088_12570, partial [Deltaproteobacteria bacterium]|nr:hypothetical protein [Deltaproteobacteria bacterium]
MSSKYLFVFASLWVFSCAEITIPERSDAGKDQGIEDAAEEEAAGEDVDAIDIFPEVDIPVQECNSDADCASITVEVCQRVFCNMTKKKCEVKFSEYGTPCFAVALTIGECEESRCDGNGECKIYPAGEETPCEFDDLCKRGKCKSGECKPGDPVECNDGNECTDDSCESDKGCVFLKVSEKPCSQSNPCMEGAMCVEGVCQGHPKICGDTNICTDDYCNEKTGECEYQGNSNPCDDGNKCTNDDYCSDGDCIGGVILFCKDDNFCTDDYCDKETGQCKFANNTLACNDDNICTLNDKCSGGVCLGTMDKCDDLNPCTQDGCDPLKDGCWHKTIPNCLNCTSDTQCNDNNVCTKEACDSNKCNYENP